MLRYRADATNPGDLVAWPLSCNGAFEASICGAGAASALDFGNEAWFIQQAAQWGLALFKVSEEQGGVAPIVVDGQTVNVPRIGPNSLATPTAWMRALALGWLVRDTRVASQLAAIDLAVPNASVSGVDREAYLRPMTEALAAFELEDPSTLGKARRARELTHPDALERFVPALMVERVHGAPLDILIALASDDADAFSDAVGNAIAGHAAYVIEDERTHQHDLLLPWLVLGLAAKGYDRGWTVQIDSGYFPTWMVVGGSNSP